AVVVRGGGEHPPLLSFDRRGVAARDVVEDVGAPERPREELRALLLPPLGAPHPALHVEQLRAGLLLLPPQPRQLPRQRLLVPPQPLHLPLAAAAAAVHSTRRRRARAGAAAAAADVGEEVALPAEEVLVGELPPVGAHLPESLQ
ncbi:Os06g0565250, partial [Oryza sativa Japonica Group]